MLFSVFVLKEAVRALYAEDYVSSEVDLAENISNFGLRTASGEINVTDAFLVWSEERWDGICARGSC